MRIKYLIIVTACIFTQSVYAETNTERYFNSIKADPQKLTAFLEDMPKGGDLHNHESGASYAENMFEFAAHDNLCVNPQTLEVSMSANCTMPNLLNNAVKNIPYEDKIVDAWSMEDFISGKQSGHDHFFATFAKFNMISSKHSGEILAEIVDRAATQNESYLELMVTPDNNESGQLGKQLGYDADFNKMRDKLLAASEFKKIVENIHTALKADDRKKEEMLNCGTKEAKPGCTIRVNYLYQVLREQVPEMVFAQLLAGFETAAKTLPDNHVVGINMVQAEDGPISMRDYKLHMSMVAFLHKLYPDVHISLHAGELTGALVPEQGLTFHIHDAINVAGATRVGHGVDIIHETDYGKLLMQMAEQRILVEINLTSNAGILNVDGKSHPLPLYYKHGVPLALSTDDEGVNRSNLTREYLHAVNTFQLTYPIIKDFARNSITYSFLKGDALWVDKNYRQLNYACRNDMPGSTNISSACRFLLDSSEKARMQWDLEKRFINFENQYT